MPIFGGNMLFPRLSFVLSMLALTFALGLSAQVDSSQQISAATCLLEMREGWERLDGERRAHITLPYVAMDAEAIELYYRFCAPDNVEGDSLFLYMEGLAWDAELILDDAYLGNWQHPLQTWGLALAPQLIRPGEWHEIRLRLRLGPASEWSPEPFLAMLQAPRLLSRAQLLAYEQTVFPQQETGDSVAIVAPYYRRSGYFFDQFEAVRNLQPVLDAGIDKVFFPFPADRSLRELCAQLGLTEVLHLQDTTNVCLVNAYPYEARYFPCTDRFWLDEAAFRTVHYGDFFVLGSWSISRLTHDSSSLGLILMLLFPLLCLFLLKIMNPGFFMGQEALLLNPKLHLGSALDTTGSNTGLMGILMLLKGLNLSMLISLLVYYVMRENQWEQLNLIRDWSLLNQWFYGSDSLWQIFVRSIELVSIWFVLKYAFLAILGQGFQVKNLVEGIMGLEIAASYPLILFLSLPMGLILFMDTLWGGWLIGVFFLLALVYASRRMYVFFIGLERLFGFSSGVKFLYICALNLIPYLIWF